MKTGIELIKNERKEQIKKHGYTRSHDKKHNTQAELIQGARYCLGEAEWPMFWSPMFKQKIDRKTQIQKLIVAGAFYMAEQDRIGPKRNYANAIKALARRIDKLNQ